MIQATNATPLLPKSLQSLINSLKKHSILTPEGVRNCILKANIAPQELMPWANFNHPLPDSYGRQLVYDGGHFEVMVMSWSPGDYSAIHDHGCTQWGAVQCFGIAEHYVYKFRHGILRTTKRIDFAPQEVKLVDGELIHQMGNSGQSEFLSLHIYGSQNSNSPITGNARVFDLWEGSIQRTDGGVFFCLPEEQINSRSYGLQGDWDTTLRHHQKMRDRLCRLLDIQEDSQLRLKLTALQKQIKQLEAESPFKEKK